MATLTKQDQKAYERAKATGSEPYIERELAIIARSGTKRTYTAVCELIERFHDFRNFTMRNGALVHNTEL